MSTFTDNDDIACVDGELRLPIITACITTPLQPERAWYLFGNVQDYSTFLKAMEAYDVKVHSIHPLEGKPSVNPTD